MTTHIATGTTTTITTHGDGAGADTPGRGGTRIGRFPARACGFVPVRTLSPHTRRHGHDHVVIGNVVRPPNGAHTERRPTIDCIAATVRG